MNPIYYVLAVLIAVIAVVCFWLISKKAPKGTLLAVGIAIWIIGRIIGSQPTREIKLIGGLIQTLGTIGFIVGLIDMFRQRKT